MRNPVLVGERVYLRPLETADAPEFARAWSGETETFFEPGRIPVSPFAFVRWVEDTQRAQPPDGVTFAVCLRADDRLLGIVSLHRLDLVNRVAESGSALLRSEDRGRGLGTEAKHLLLEYAFDRLHLHAVWSSVWEPNTRSAAALAKQGYRPAGRLARDAVKDGAYRAELRFDVLRDEWLAAREAWRASREGRGK